MRAPQTGLSRRQFVVVLAGGTAGLLPADPQDGGPPAGTVPCRLTVNGQKHDLLLDPRVTLLDLLREHLQLTGTKKGCDHGQCGACTVLVNGRRVDACLSLAVSHDGDAITTIEGLAQGDVLHPMQAAFLAQDGLQCGYCTPGQICSAVAMLAEARRGAPSAVTPDLRSIRPIALTDDEVRERMSGNLCRCGAYVGIVAAIRSVAGKFPTGGAWSVENPGGGGT
jgi:xanthine dehydrogenase YagT iron-sulfur-binding subunit